MVTNEDLLKLVVHSDKELSTGTQLYIVQDELRKYQNNINTLPLVERFEMACNAKTKLKSIQALIHCRCILEQIIRDK